MGQDTGGNFIDSPAYQAYFYSTGTSAYSGGISYFWKPEYDIVVSNSEFYDDQLEIAIKAFQRQHGLNADGIIGKIPGEPWT